MSFGLSPRFPLSISEYGDFFNNVDIKDVVKQNFKNLLLTVPGERIMLPDFGVGVPTYLFEFRNSTGQNSLSNLQSSIKEQSRKYLPYIEILGVVINSSEDEHFLSLKIGYFIKPLSITDSIEIS
jgi:phage baseplate assembly protein W